MFENWFPENHFLDKQTSPKLDSIHMRKTNYYYYYYYYYRKR